MNMRLQRFDFGSLRDFRGPLAEEPEILIQQEEELPPPPPPPTFSEEDLEFAKATEKKLGFAEGYAAGLAHAAEQADTKRQIAEQTIAQLGGMLAETQHRYQLLLENEALELSQLVIHIAKKITGTMLRDDSATAVTALIAQCLPVVLSKPQLTVELNPEAFTQTMDQIEETMQKNGYEGQLQFRGNTTLGPHDAVLDWGTGVATRDTKALWQEIEQVLLAHPFKLSSPFAEHAPEYQDSYDAPVTDTPQNIRPIF